jgi:hypothetical protein
MAICRRTTSINTATVPNYRSPYYCAKVKKSTNIYNIHLISLNQPWQIYTTSVHKYMTFRISSSLIPNVIYLKTGEYYIFAHKKSAIMLTRRFIPSPINYHILFWRILILPWNEIHSIGEWRVTILPECEDQSHGRSPHDECNFPVRCASGVRALPSEITFFYRGRSHRSHGCMHACVFCDAVRLKPLAGALVVRRKDKFRVRRDRACSSLARQKSPTPHTTQKRPDLGLHCFHICLVRRGKGGRRRGLIDAPRSPTAEKFIRCLTWGRVVFIAH